MAIISIYSNSISVKRVTHSDELNSFFQNYHLDLPLSLALWSFKFQLIVSDCQLVSS